MLLMTPVATPDTDFVKSLIRVPRKGEKRWKNADGDRIYTWDSLHGEFEVFNNRGEHLGVIDADGKPVLGKEQGIRGRTIDV